MSLTRRTLLHLAAGAGLASVAPGLSGCGGEGHLEPREEPFDPAAQALFRHGLASGDPLPDAVILWTHISPEEPVASATVTWEVAEGREFTEIVASGAVETDAERDFTVKVDAQGLSPGRTYYYRFHALGRTSPVGRTRTAPEGGVDRLRFAVASCASLKDGYFHVYRALAGRLDLDAVLHLGDYIYEYGGSDGDVRRFEPPHEILTLDDYRARYSQYRKDADLRAVHQQHPFIVVWDDHESANNSWKGGAENHTAGAEGAWESRVAAARRAYAEWMPLRDAEDGRIFRSLRYGDLVDVLMLDTRLWGRDQQVENSLDPALDDPERSLLGADQEAWLAAELGASTARWRLIGQQVMMGELRQIFNGDQWDGYPHARRRFYDTLADSAVDNVVVLTGDIHTSWAIELSPEPGGPAEAVEFVTPAVTSQAFPAVFAGLKDTILAESPHVKLCDLVNRGYVVLDVTAERVQAAWFHYDHVDEPKAPPELFAGAFAVRSGEARLHAETEPAPPPLDPPPPGLPVP